MARIKYEDGTVIDFEGDPSPAEIEEAYGAVRGSQPQAPQPAQEESSPDPLFEGVTLSQGSSSESPASALSNWDRAVFSLGDEKGQEEFLKKRFAVVARDPETGGFLAGNRGDALLPIDPKGITNDFFGDLADHANLILPTAAQIMGATAGAAGGPAGVIGGGAVGAGLGEAANKALGKAFGVNAQTATEQATDAAITSLFGAGGEALGQGLKGAANVMKPAVARYLARGVRTSPNPDHTLSMIAKVFRFTARVDEQDVIDAGVYGFDKTLSGPYTNPNYLGKLTTDFIRGTLQHNRELGRAVDAGDNWALRNFGNRVLPIQEAAQELLDTLAHPRAGLLDANYRWARGFGKPGEHTVVKNVLGLFFEASPAGGFAPRAIPFGQALDYKKRLSQPLTKYFQSGASNDTIEIGMGRFFDRLRTAMEEVTMPPTQHRGLLRANNPFVRANQAYSAWKNDLGLLKRNGLDITDTSKFDDFFRDGKLVDSKVETFMKSLQHKTSASQESFAMIANQIPVRFAGGGVGGAQGTLFDELRKFTAAQGFRNTNPDFLRLGAVASILGVTGILDRSTPEGKLGALGTGLLIGTPKGASMLLKGASKVGNIPRAMLQATVSQSARAGSGTERAGVALLSQLLRAGVPPSNISRSTSQQPQVRE